MTTVLAPGRIGVRTLLPALASAPMLRYAVAVHAVPDDGPWRTTCVYGRPLWPNVIGPSGRCAACGRLDWHSWTAVYAGDLLGLGTGALTASILRRLDG